MSTASLTFPDNEVKVPRAESSSHSAGASLSRAQPMVINPRIRVLLPGALVSDLVRLGHQDKELSPRYESLRVEEKI